ncbi:MAG: HD-GYP domain-containing protein [Burkholderiales bacterium]|jgi:HD-GYP domain-containing protein (c-di-GMP phosphodiesterase class II)|nr:HD-GYP domain-containing protein [Burkholderiales bacterium]
MIKQITPEQLKPGMYIHDLNCDWMSHPFVRSRFLLDNPDDIRKIVDAGIREVYIDTKRGADVPDAPTIAEVKAEVEAEMKRVAEAPIVTELRVSTSEELERATRIHKQAHSIVKRVMQDVRLGRAVEIEAVEGVVEDITASILRNAGALIGLGHIKDADEYTFLHSVSVGTLLVAFARSMKLDDATIRQAGIGGLLHDTGKAKTPTHILNKPGKLTDEEFAVIRRHPQDGYDILVQTPDVGEIPLTITIQHHERVDGSGYPNKLPAGDIHTLGKMAAIVDVYDAITADRVYHKGMQPTDALRKLFEWSKFHFDSLLVQSFLRCIGIYPTGTLVMLESGRLAVVTQQHDSNMLLPTVRTIFDTKKNVYVKPEYVDLSRKMGAGGADRITGHEAPEKWGIDPMRFM